LIDSRNLAEKARRGREEDIKWREETGRERGSETIRRILEWGPTSNAGGKALNSGGGRDSHGRFGKSSGRKGRILRAG